MGSTLPVSGIYANCSRRLVVESGITVFLSSHLLSEVEQIATYLGIIHQGRLLFQGTLNELQRTRRGRTLIRTNDPQAVLASP
jgi:ABC-2 type transport system ATP-binding protein